jgi:excisionase family DNA binding protein
VARHYIGMRKTTISNRGVGDLRHLELLTIEEFAQLFSISPRSVYSLVAAGVVRRVKVGRLTRIHHSEIERYSKYLQATSGHKGGCS